MKPETEITRSPQSGEPTSQGDLVASVTLLAEGAARMAWEGLPDAPQLAQLADRALASAAEAEARLAEQMSRIVELERLALTDELTGILNRRGFQRELTHALAAARRYDEKGVLVYVDLDGFKPINDTYGHAAGDEVLRRVARILQDNVRDTDAVGRMGGDEFAVLLARSSWEDGLRRAEALDRALNNAFIGWEGRMIAIRASLGIQVYGNQDEDQALLERADEDMYKSKRLRSEIGNRRDAGRARN
ncbi:MAG: GGDEF domain-containing protein [Magnetospirillum sp. WYHS-4]